MGFGQLSVCAHPWLLEHTTIPLSHAHNSTLTLPSSSRRLYHRFSLGRALVAIAAELAAAGSRRRSAFPARSFGPELHKVIRKLFPISICIPASPLRANRDPSFSPTRAS